VKIGLVLMLVGLAGCALHRPTPQTHLWSNVEAVYRRSNLDGTCDLLLMVRYGSADVRTQMIRQIDPRYCQE
jgi:hypothetical protein